MTERMQKQRSEVLECLGVTEVEYEAMLCPYYGSPLGPREMASRTVLESDCGCGSPGRPHSADEYLQAIEGMMQKGWLSIETGNSEDEEAALNSEDIPRPEGLVLPEGCVTFTRKGYFLHRRILRALHGRCFVQQVDSFERLDEPMREVHFYAGSRRLCLEWIHNVQQATGLHSLSTLVNAPAEILQITGPRKIGRWRPSRYLVLKSGYHVLVRYKRLRRRRFKVPELGVYAWVESLKPVHIFGTLRGLRFSFMDLPSWRRSRFDDSTAFFEWSFEVDAEPRIEVPRRAILSGEEGTVGGYLVRNVVFSMEEQPPQPRSNMLSIEEAKELARTCAEKYIAQLR